MRGQASSIRQTSTYSKRMSKKLWGSRNSTTRNASLSKFGTTSLEKLMMARSVRKEIQKTSIISFRKRIRIFNDMWDQKLSAILRVNLIGHLIVRVGRVTHRANGSSQRVPSVWHVPKFKRLILMAPKTTKSIELKSNKSKIPKRTISTIIVDSKKLFKLWEMRSWTLWNISRVSIQKSLTK